ncbi:MAG: RNA polymerase sigma factor [Candidatus Zixiibacteriota bacterium]|nr:MAG: RNA polymerase sigma factor [candidate division Zixibacteria bacterium]UCE67330.1 MAG: RNA polymerase sigma factor [candidate division Zixibacteria bacterium]
MNGYPIKIPGITVRGKMTAAEIEGDISDNSLVLQILQGKVKSFKILVERYQKGAYLFAVGMIGNHDDAYDLSQEAFIRAYKNLNRFNPVYQFRTWFFRILSNLCKNHLRQQANRGSVLTSSEMIYAAAAPRHQRPDVLFEKSEIQREVWNCVNELPDKFREIIILNHFQDMFYEQVAKVLDIPRGSVMSRLYYARLKLREILEKRGIKL